MIPVQFKTIVEISIITNTSPIILLVDGLIVGLINLNVIPIIVANNASFITHNILDNIDL